jgi:hypothetical protein
MWSANLRKRPLADVTGECDGVTQVMAGSRIEAAAAGDQAQGRPVRVAVLPGGGSLVLRYTAMERAPDIVVLPLRRQA